MVPNRVFQTVRVGLTVGLALVLLALGGADAGAEEPAPGGEFPAIDTIVVDLRPGDAPIRSPSHRALVEALSEHGELRLNNDQELNALLARAPYSPVLVRGRETLSGAALAYGSLNCSSTIEQANAALLDLSAARASGVDASSEMRQAYLYLFLCADRDGHIDDAMAAATMLRTLGEGQRPKPISENTWAKYPEVDAHSNLRRVRVELQSEPAGAQLWIDHRRVGKTPSVQLLGEGQHLIAMGHGTAGVSQTITVTGPGTVKLPLRAVESRWKGLSRTLDEARAANGAEREQVMSNIMAAVEAQVAFVMREPGRVAVWILPVDRRSPELVGNAPNASIAGTLALTGLNDSASRPGLDPNMPLLRETPATDTRASSTRRWWIYGALLGAAAIGAGFIVAQDLSEDRQRIEVTLP